MLELTSTKQRVPGCTHASMAARTLLRIARVSLSGQSWQICRRIQAAPGLPGRGSVSALKKSPETNEMRSARRALLEPPSQTFLARVMTCAYQVHHGQQSWGDMHTASVSG